jgi:hypothetical protein
MFESLTKKAKLDQAKKLFINALDRDMNWQAEARDDFNFRDGDQWSTDEKQILAEELRPILTFNLTKSHVDLIMGMNEDNRVIHRATPFEPTDTFLCDVLNDLSDFVSQTENFEEEEDGALESAAICGRGWCAIDFQPDPRRFGNITLSLLDVPVHEVHFDPAARRPGLEDASYLVWDRWMTQEDFKIRFPKVGAAKLEGIINDTATISGTSDPVSSDLGLPISDDPTSDYERPLDSDINFYDRNKSMIRIVHMEYWEYYKKYFAYNPETGAFEEIPSMPSKAQKVEFFDTFGEDMTIETMYDKRVKWLQFVGDEILFDDVSPLPFPGFSLVPMFAYRDASKRSNNHYGLVRLMKDPQREVNKRWSQALNMLNQQVQPGVYAETDAFVDEAQALQSMKVAGDITWVNAGSLTGGKIKERTVPTFPNAPMQMEQFSQDIMKKITGINPDLLGQDRGRQEPGVVVRMRQQQGMTLLKPLFRNFNFMKKEIFKRKLAIIMEYMPDKQILQVLGQNERYSIDPQSGVITDNQTGHQAELRNVRALEYNVVAEQAPGNTTTRMLELQSMLEMMQTLPVPPEQIIEKLDIAADEKARWIEYISQQQQAQAEQQEEMKNLEVQFKERELGQTDQKNTMDFLIDMAKLKQMAEKDEKALVTKFAQIDQGKQANILQFAGNMATMLGDMADRDNKNELAEKQLEQGGQSNGEGKQSTPKKD